MERKRQSLSECKFALDDAGGFTGYASTFGNVDSVGDTILPGAYKDTLAEFGLPKMFFNHDMWGVPIGKWVDAKEDDVGLLLTGEFTPGNIQAESVRSAIKHGSVDGLSIGFRLKSGDFDESEDGRRTIKKVSQLLETSVVTFPADDFARIDLDSVKSAMDGIQNERDFENFLREAGGFSRSAAKHLVHCSRSLFGLREADDTDDKKASEVAAMISLRARALGHRLS